jgi:hypothetical protein
MLLPFLRLVTRSRSARYETLNHSRLSLGSDAERCTTAGPETWTSTVVVDGSRLIFPGPSLCSSQYDARERAAELAFKSLSEMDWSIAPVNMPDAVPTPGASNGVVAMTLSLDCSTTPRPADCPPPAISPTTPPSAAQLPYVPLVVDGSRPVAKPLKMTP